MEVFASLWPDKSTWEEEAEEEAMATITTTMMRRRRIAPQVGVVALEDAMDPSIAILMKKNKAIACATTDGWAKIAIRKEEAVIPLHCKTVSAAVMTLNAAHKEVNALPFP